ncbi:hypothetical protein FN846DRAFT_984105 [Sphaerosporella brunnea]|uniref:Uncharacterized protein n=1 Tax=Sphaerosporella brunnea TaxID=1250544 RepID=A0A5J5EUU4_9PEZI|nr:hypothetical protein FN846DRAFT_984105 [Sphaerosporella brunnea]
MPPRFRSFVEDPYFLYQLKAAGNLPSLPIQRPAPDPFLYGELVSKSKMFFEAELFPRLPRQWIEYCMRVQTAYDRIHWVLETRSQGGWDSVYYGECVTIERGLGILNQFVKRHTGLLKLEVSQLQSRVHECRLEDILVKDPTVSLHLTNPPDLIVLLQLDHLLKSVGFDGKYSPTQKLLYLQYMGLIIEDWEELLQAMDTPEGFEGSHAEETLMHLKAAMYDAQKMRQYVECLQRVWLSLSATHYAMIKYLRRHPARPIIPDSREAVLLSQLKSMLQILKEIEYPETFLSYYENGDSGIVLEDFYRTLREPMRLLNHYCAIFSAEMESAEWDGRAVQDDIDFEVVAPSFLEVLRYTENVEDDVPMVDMERSAGMGPGDIPEQPEKPEKAHVVREWARFVKSIDMHRDTILDWVIARRGSAPLRLYPRVGKDGPISNLLT